MSFLSCLMSGSPGQPCGLPDKPRSDLSPRDTPAQLSSRPSGQGSGAVARSGMAGSRRGRHGQRLGLVEGVATVGKIQSWGGQNRPLEGGVGWQALEAFRKVRLPQRGNTQERISWADGRGGTSGQGAPSLGDAQHEVVLERCPGPAVKPPAQPARPAPDTFDL